jgi:hypothetical protein
MANMATLRTWKLGLDTEIVIFVISSPALWFIWNRLKSYFPAFTISDGSFGNGCVWGRATGREINFGHCSAVVYTTWC